jgi:hypothetical protein
MYCLPASFDVSVRGEFSPMQGMVFCFVVAAILAAFFVVSRRRERIFGIPPYDRYAEPVGYFAVQTSYAFGSAVFFCFGVLSLLDIIGRCL